MYTFMLRVDMQCMCVCVCWCACVRACVRILCSVCQELQQDGAQRVAQ